LIDTVTAKRAIIMPTDQEFQQQAENFKTKGNAAFGKGSIAEAISFYSQGIVLCDRAAVDSVVNPVKTTLLSNRAMCYLKDLKTLDKCIEDCTSGLALGPSDVTLRNKLLFRRAKAAFLSSNLPDNSKSSNSADQLQDAAKDLLQVINTDPNNKDASQLLKTVRAQYKTQQANASTPVSKALQQLKASDEPKKKLHQIKLLLGMFDNDLKNAAMELGRIGGVSTLLETIQNNQQLVSFDEKSKQFEPKLTVLTIQCLSQASSHPPFVREYMVNHQQDLGDLIDSESMDADAVVLGMAVLVRIILHADRDPFDQEISGKTLLDYDVIIHVIKQATARSNFANKNQRNVVIRGVLDLISTWTAGLDRETNIRQSLGPGIVDPTLPAPKSKMEIHAFTPQQLAAHRRRESDRKDRDGAWAFERCIRILSNAFDVMLKATREIEDHVVRREMVVSISRMLAVLDDEDRIKNVVKPYLSSEEDRDGPIIEEVNDDDEEKLAELEESGVALDTIMERAIITCALLLSKKEVGSWALGTGWNTSGDELPRLIESDNSQAMFLASEVVSAASTVESSRHLVASLVSSGSMQRLLKNPDRDIRSGAASAVAKLGMSDKAAQKDEGEMMGMLLAACDLLEDDEVDGKPKTPSKDEAKLRHFSSFATSSVERGVEMISYLVSNTVVKEELAAGFSPSMESTSTALERLVKTADLPNSGESLTGFALATIFQHMAATNKQIRREGFEGKEVTMEQYDEMQKLGKTADEKEVMESEEDPDTTASAHERIRKMASANVPRALVVLVEGASEHTLEQVALGFSRMADEQSVRGIMIQQGVLTCCIKIDKNESPTDSDTMKKVVTLARHCIGKMLVTTNPTLLTSAQRLGAIRPLIQLVRDIKSSDLQKFEALLSLTNLGGSGDDAQNRIVSEKGITTMHFAMFSDHDMVRRAATECMSNLVQHKAMMDHLKEEGNLKLWYAFATDFEDHYDCARAAAGCLAMATQDPIIAEKVVEMEKFRPHTETMLECGRLEIMHRIFVLVHNLVAHGGKTREKVVKEGFVAFCEAYVASYHQGTGVDLEFSDQERALLPVVAEIAATIVQMADEDELEGAE